MLNVGSEFEVGGQCYSLHPPLRNHDIKKLWQAQVPQGPKKPPHDPKIGTSWPNEPRSSASQIAVLCAGGCGHAVGAVLRWWVQWKGGWWVRARAEPPPKKIQRKTTVEDENFSGGGASYNRFFASLFTPAYSLHLFVHTFREPGRWRGLRNLPMVRQSG